jgi:hypothetical protein
MFIIICAIAKFVSSLNFFLYQFFLPMNNTKQKRSRANQMQDSFHYKGGKKEIAP